VTTPVGDNAVHVAPPRRGLLVPVDDVDALAQAVEAALQSPWDRREIARYGEDYTWHEVARQTARFFEERTGNGTSRPRARALEIGPGRT
jgi:glycosyltransferase involved in cell wall biosynthesis